MNFFQLVLIVVETFFFFSVEVDYNLPLMKFIKK